MKKKKDKTARAVHANRGIEAKYRKTLNLLIEEMADSVEFWLSAAYKKAPPRMAKLISVAQDASPSAKIRYILDNLAIRWIKKFDILAPKIAERFCSSMFSSTDASFKKSLKDAGWAVDFDMTPAMKDALNASIEGNVGLIKSIPDYYFTSVEEIVMRSYSTGRDLETMTKDLKKLYPAASHRAELIARDQSNKANSVVIQARRMEIGITEAVWMHSHAGKTPRQDHLSANGKRFKVSEGCLISGEYIQPGWMINCRCTSRSVLPTYQ